MQLFLFPLVQAVFYPGTQKPLNIFEPRYLQMVEDSLATGTPIALGFVDEAQTQEHIHVGQGLAFVRKVVGFGKPHILEKRADGTLLILLQAEGKAVLGKVTSLDKPYLQLEAELVQEDLNVATENMSQYLALQRMLVTWISKNISEAEVREQFLRQIQSPEQFVNACCAYLVKDPDFQQMLLEENILNRRIHILSGLMLSGELS